MDLAETVILICAMIACTFQVTLLLITSLLECLISTSVRTGMALAWRALDAALRLTLVVCGVAFLAIAVLQATVSVVLAKTIIGIDTLFGIFYGGNVEFHFHHWNAWVYHYLEMIHCTTRLAVIFASALRIRLPCLVAYLNYAAQELSKVIQRELDIEMELPEMA